MGYSLAIHVSIGIIFAVVTLTRDSIFSYELGLFLLYAITAQGVGFCWGRTGIISLGNAVFFGLSAYLAGYILKTFSSTMLLLILLPAGVLISSFFAFLFAYILLKKTENSIFFSLITLATAMLAALIATSWSSVTGGFDGMLDIPSIAGLDNIEDLHWIILPISVFVSFTLFYLAKSPYGVLLRAGLNNELRLRFLGFSTTTLKAVTFAISALCASIAGVLYAPHQGIVTPQAIGFFLSAEFVIWSAVGGRHSIYGPLIGTLAIGFLTSEIKDTISYWEIIIATLFIFIVIYSPNGMVGVFKNIWQTTCDKFRFNIENFTISPRIRKEKIIVDKHKKTTFEKLVISDLTFSANDSRILENLNLTLDKSCIYAFIGPNGAGKTTVFNAITKNIEFQKGNIFLGEDNLNKKTSEAIIKHNLSRKFQIPSIFGNLTVRENLLVATWSKRLSFISSFKLKPLQWYSPLMDELLEYFSFLKEKYEFKASTLSQGEKQMLEFAMIVCSEPNIMLLDEPCAGLSPSETKYMIESIAHFATKLGSCVLIIEHDMDAVKKIADQVLVLHKGSLLFSGTMEEVQKSSLVKNIYSGGHK